MNTNRDNTGPETYPAEKARQGEIVLRTPLRRAIFIGGLVGALFILIIAQFLLP
jgi:hypothetical protein